MPRLMFVIILAVLTLIPMSVLAKPSSKVTTSSKLSGNWTLRRNYTKSSDGSTIASKSEQSVITITQKGSNLTVYFKGVDSSLYTFKGTITGSTVKLTYSGQGGFVEKLNGTLSADKQTISGKLDVDWGEPGNNGKSLHHFGTWKATKK